MTHHTQLALEGLDNQTPSEPDRVPGLDHRPDFITAAVEQRLLTQVDAASWMHDLSRRVQHYGWRYDYTARTVTPDQYLGPIPAWLDEIGRAISDVSAMPPPDQVIVNEYEPGQGIARHTDCIPCFGPTVAMVSLGSDIQMDFENPDEQLVPLLVARRSLVILAGDARTHWKHGIARRKADRQFGIRRERRVSLTFRTVNVGIDDPL